MEVDSTQTFTLNETQTDKNENVLMSAQLAHNTHGLHPSSLFTYHFGDTPVPLYPHRNYRYLLTCSLNLFTVTPSPVKMLQR